ncbi:hypothetical protein OF846_003875 [Rhodotorula toruloides]|nr:hypothetical protein OF846_003875 [Rhodotorula toruloides]
MAGGKLNGLASDNVEERTVTGMIRVLGERVAALEPLQAEARDLWAKVTDLRAELMDLRAEKERAKFVYAAKLCLKGALCPLILDLMLEYANKSDAATVSYLYDRLHALCLTNWRSLHDKLLSSHNRPAFEDIVPPSFFDALQAAVRAFKNKTLDPHNPFTASLRITTVEAIKAKNKSRNEDAHSSTRAIFSEICRDVAQVDSKRIESLIELLPEDSWS